MRDNIRYIFLLGPAIGTCLEIGGFYWKKKINEKLNKTVKTTGTVLRLESRRGGTGFDTSGGTVYYPVVEFSVNGEVYTTAGDVASMKPKYSVGDKIEISYNPEDPNNSGISGDEFLGPQALMLIGGVFIFLGTIAFISISLTPN